MGKRYIVASIVSGFFVEDFIDNDKEVLYDDIESFISALGDAAAFDDCRIAIEFTEENVAAIVDAGYLHDSFLEENRDALAE